MPPRERPRTIPPDPALPFAMASPPSSAPSSAAAPRSSLSVPDTPGKRKSSSIERDSSGAKRVSRKAFHVNQLIEAELKGCTFQSMRFLEDFIYEPNALSAEARAAHAESLLRRLCQASPPPVQGLSFHSLIHSYFCTPPDYSASGFPPWFCGFANAVAALNAPTGTVITTGITPTPTWIVTSNRTLSGAHNEVRRPDFCLSTKGTQAGFDWRRIVIIGEHHSKGSSAKEAFIQLGCYAEQVFIAQPFRTAVLGVFTSNKAPGFEVWRFDRAGAFGSYYISYAGGAGLRDLVLALEGMATIASRLAICGYHTSSISWNKGALPIDERSEVSVRLPQPQNEEGISTLHYKDLVFRAKGLVARGTRVWTGVLRDAGGTERYVAIKESWRSIGRVPEAQLYHLAAAHGVHGLPALIHSTTHEEVQSGVRLSHIPHTNSLAADAQDKYASTYTAHMAGHNRVFSRLVLNQVGVSIDTEGLGPQSVARALLAAAMGHASLFFRANILHRDVSPYNILAFSSQESTLLPPPAALVGTPHSGLYGRQRELHGCLLDLDYAIDTSGASAASGAKDRTGTYPFISIQCLRGGVTHRYRHDLESLLYVLLWLSLYPRPESSDQPAQEEDTRAMWKVKDPLEPWFTEAESMVAALKELGIVTSDAHFEDLLVMFREGFVPFGIAAGRIRQALWGVPGGGACQVAREGLQGELELEAEMEAAAAAAAASGGRRRRAQVSRGEGRGRGKGASRGQSRNVLQQRPRPIEAPAPRPTRKWLRADEVRVGVSNWEAYLEVLAALEDLVDTYEQGSEAGEALSGSESEWETEEGN